jgi:hypothetical protein
MRHLSQLGLIDEFLISIVHGNDCSATGKVPLERVRSLGGRTKEVTHNLSVSAGLRLKHGGFISHLDGMPPAIKGKSRRLRVGRLVALLGWFHPDVYLRRVFGFQGFQVDPDSIQAGRGSPPVSRCFDSGSKQGRNHWSLEGTAIYGTTGDKIFLDLRVEGQLHGEEFSDRYRDLSELISVSSLPFRRTRISNTSSTYFPRATAHSHMA